MRLLVLGAFTLIISLGEAKAPERLSQGLPGNINVYLEPNDVGCKRKLYKPEFQLPLPRQYTGIYKSAIYPRATVNEEEFNRVLEIQDGWLKEIMSEEAYGDYKKLGLDNHIEKVHAEKPHLKELKEKAKKVAIENKAIKLLKDIDHVSEREEAVKMLKKAGYLIENDEDVDKILNELRGKVALKLDMDPGQDVPRGCIIINEDGICKIDVSEFYKPYKPNEVVGLHLKRGHLPASSWIKPDDKDVKKYSGLWHTDSEKDLIIHHDYDKNEKRILDRCSFYGKYELDENGYPINPITRTGFITRGELYQWGPSKGVGAILYSKSINDEFSFLGVMNGKYERPEDRRITTPGGYVDPAEEFEDAAKRELIEEGLANKKIGKEEKAEFENKLKKLMGDGELVIFGYNDAKETNTDNAWTESVTYAFGIDHKNLKEFEADHGSDAIKAMWMTIKVNEDSSEVKSLMEKVIKEESKSAKEEKMDEMQVDLPVEETTVGDAACRTEYVDEDKLEKTEDIADKEAGESSSRKAKETKKVPIEICLNLNDKKTMNMEGVARLFLVKLYGEMPYLEFLAKQKSNQGTYVVKRGKVSTLITGKKRLHEQESGTQKESGTQHEHKKEKKSPRTSLSPSKKRGGSPTKGR
uniref:Nudix hydrolase domain-containing protein n=1 Tax=Meloidogyne javanica TaxID=6303 RepID=A0A915MR32_MELJA